jgi:predicted dehydrogenase
MNVGIIGTGFGARVHVPVLQAHPDYEVVALSSVYRGNASEVAAEHNVPKAFSNWKTMIDELPELDLIVVATNPEHHMEMTLAALSAGKSVVCEKPPALSLEQAMSMQAAAQRAKTIAAMNFEWRYLPERQKIKQILVSNQIGRPLHINWHLSWPMWPALAERPNSWLWQKSTGGGLLGAIGSHIIDSLAYWFGPLKALHGHTQNHVHTRQGPLGFEATDADDSFFFHGVTETGTTITVQFTIAASSTDEMIEFFGETGTLKLTDKRLELLIKDHPAQELELDQMMDTSPFSDAIKGFVHPQSKFYDDFAKAVQGKQANALPTLSDAAYVQATLDTIRQSARAMMPIPAWQMG